MKRFLQICVREQGNCSEQFKHVPRHPLSGTSELGQSEDWRLPDSDYPTSGIVLSGDSLIVIHEARSGAQCSPLLLPVDRFGRDTYGDAQRRGLPTGLINCRISAVGVTDQAWVEGNCEALQIKSEGTAPYGEVNLADTPWRQGVLALGLTTGEACLVVKSGVQRTPMGKPLTSA